MDPGGIKEVLTQGLSVSLLKQWICFPGEADAGLNFDDAASPKGSRRI